MLERLFLNRPRLTVALGLLMAALSLLVAFHKLSFTTDRTQLLDPRSTVQRNWSRYRKEFGRTTDFVLLLKSADADMARQATELLGQRLRDNGAFEHVFYRLDLPEASRHGLYFLKKKKLEELRGHLQAALPWLRQLSHRSGAEILLEKLETPPAQLAADIRPLLPQLNRILQGLCGSLESGGRAPFISPLGPFLADVPALEARPLEPGQSRFYNQLADGKTYMVVALPRDNSGTLQADIQTLQQLRKEANLVRRSFPEVNLFVSGEPAINTEEMEGAIGDATRCASIALLLTSLLLVLAFGQITRPVCAVLSLLLGLCWSVGLASLTVGQLNLLTVHFVTILTGLGITFGIQFLSQFQVLRCRGQQAREAILGCLVEARHQGVGAITTAIAFFSLQSTSFRAAAELGWVTGAGVLLCYLATISMLPCLLLLAEGQRACSGFPEYGRWLAPWEVWLRRNPKGTTLVCLVITLASCSQFGRIPFDYNLLHMQSPEAEAIRVEAYLQKIGYSTLYAVSLAPSAEQGRLRQARLEAIPSVSRVESVLSLEPRDLQSKRPVVEQLVQLAEQIPPPRSSPPLDGDQLLDLYQRYQSLQPQLRELQRNLGDVTFSEALQRLQGLLNPNNPGPVAAGLQSYQDALQRDFLQQQAFLRQQQSAPPDILAMVPEEVRLRSISPQGTVCLRIFPRENPWERDSLGRFVRDLEQVDGNVTGTPILIFTYLEELRQAYGIAGRNALLVIVILLMGHYRSWRFAGLALLPKLAGVAWMIGGLALLGAEFNAANFLALPLTLGIGLIFGMESLRMCRLPGPPLMARQSAGFAVALSGLTTILGFSTLMVAQHRGVASFGLVMSLGVGMNLITSLVMLPALMGWARRR